MTDPTLEARARATLARHTEQIAYDSGHGHRDLSHHPDNRYDPVTHQALHAAYQRGFADRTAQLMGAER